jgi:hypothetical protein
LHRSNTLRHNSIDPESALTCDDTKVNGIGFDAGLMQVDAASFFEKDAV